MSERPLTVALIFLENKTFLNMPAMFVYLRSIFIITVEIPTRSLTNFYCQYADRLT